MCVFGGGLARERRDGSGIASSIRETGFVYVVLERTHIFIVNIHTIFCNGESKVHGQI